MACEEECLRCPKCGRKLEYFSGLENIPEFFYCSDCNDVAYDMDGKKLALLAECEAEEYCRELGYQEPA